MQGNNFELILEEIKMDNKVLVEISARHVHVSQADLETLFGEGYELTVKKWLSQPGQFACDERVKVVGAKGEFPAINPRSRKARNSG